MKDPYLETIMRGDTPDSKTNIDVALDTLLDEYVDAALEETEQNALIPRQVQRAKMKEELKAAAEIPELTVALATAFKILIDEHNKQYVDADDYEAMVQQFRDAGEYLENIEHTTIEEEDIVSLLHFTSSTLRAIFKIAQGQYNENNLRECLSIFTLLSTLDAEHADYWYRLGIVAHQLEEYTLALKAFTKATRLNAKILGSRVFLADIYVKLGSYEEAKAEFDQAVLLAEKETPEPFWLDLLAQIKSNLNKD
ncbi:MAG: tetratricopeptide repeat protein [Verrucomicrobia bacterium]|nr:tetratricopeptide repeat protein [Verrucomicrobiota bacterium]